MIARTNGLPSSRLASTAQGFGIGAGVGIGDDPSAERFELKEPLDQVRFSVAWVPGHDDLATGLGLLDEVVVDS